MWRRRLQALAGGIVRLLIVLAVCLLLQESASACPTCRDGLANADPTQSGIARGYFWSIIFMMTMPFLLLGSLCGYFYWEVRKARLRQQTELGLETS